MYQQITLSLVIPTYNRGSLIGETLDAALRQTRPFHEIIVIDDGSTDDTEQQLLPYLPHVRYIRNTNQGVQVARNTGVSLATGNYITLCDSDDLLMPEFVAIHTEWLAAHPTCDLIYTNFCNFDEHGQAADKFSFAPAGYFDGGQSEGMFMDDIPDLYERSVRFQPMFPTGSTCRRAFYQSLGGYNPAFKGVGAEDWEFCLRAIGSGNTALCRAPLAKIRRHAGNDSANALYMTLGEIHILEHALEKHPISQRYRTTILASIADRKQSAFDGAFASGKLDQAAALLETMTAKPRGIKAALKRAILAAPSPIKLWLWRQLTR